MKNRTHSLSITTKNAVKPCRPYQRFKPSGQAHTGMSPDGAFLSFVSKDTNRFLPKPDEYRKRFNKTDDNDFNTPKAVPVPVGTSKCTYKLGLTSYDGLPKLDRTALNITTKNFPRNPTDSLSFEAPHQEKSF